MNRKRQSDDPQFEKAKVQLREFFYRTGSSLLVMADKYQPGKFAFGVSPGRGERMCFEGNFESYDAAFAAARRKRCELCKGRQRGAK